MLHFVIKNFELPALITCTGQLLGASITTRGKVNLAITTEMPHFKCPVRHGSAFTKVVVCSDTVHSEEKWKVASTIVYAVTEGDNVSTSLL